MLNLLDGSDPITIDLGSDGSLKQGDGDHYAGAAVFGAGDEAFHAGKGSMIDANALANLEKRPGDEGSFGGYQGLNGANFGVVNGDGGGAGADDLGDTGCIQNPVTFRQGEPAKQVAGKDG